MKILTKLHTDLLDHLIKCELEIIEKGFSISKTTGKIFLQNTLTHFKDNYLKKLYGDIIPSFCSEYRYFLLGLLKDIKKEYLDCAISEVLIPKIGRVTTDDLLSILNIELPLKV